MSKRVAIIGGGLTGLSAAFDLHRAGIDFELYEASARFGGNLLTSSRDGFLIEHGADSWIAQKPWLDNLARDLGINDDVVSSANISPSTSILKDGQLLPLPTGMLLFIPSDLQAVDASPLFSPETKRRIHDEETSPPAPLPDHEDESVASFVERHFGREMVDLVAAPLLAGVYGGDASQLSARAVIPRLVALERQYGSLVVGARAVSKQRPNSGLFRTMLNGMGSLIEQLVRALPASRLHLSEAIERVSYDGASFAIASILKGRGGFSHVICTTRIPQAADMFAIDLPTIRYSSAATIAFAYDQTVPLPAGFGFLAAAGEKTCIRAATFVHQKWPKRVPEGKMLLRFFLSGPQLLVNDDETLIAIASAESERLLNLRTVARFAIVDRWPESMPQYAPGHLATTARIRACVESLGKIQLAGNAFDGVGMPDAVRSGRAAAANIIAE